jgi:hypothetical protein
MTQLIHQDDHDLKLGPRWYVDRPYPSLPSLVRFIKRSQHRTLLDQTARWDGNGWDASRWVPRHPQVPHSLLTLVEAHMREVEV